MRNDRSRGTEAAINLKPLDKNENKIYAKQKMGVPNQATHRSQHDRSTQPEPAKFSNNNATMYACLRTSGVILYSPSTPSLKRIMKRPTGVIFAANPKNKKG